jgi:DNA-binding NtrC family response regulator
MAKVMVVDDEKDIRISSQRILESKGYDVVVAKNGDECLKIIEKEKPDLVLLDILMPGTPVHVVLKKIKKFRVIMFSVVTLGEGKIAESGKNVPTNVNFPNIVDYLQKPFTMSSFLKKIEKALEA